MIGEIRDGVVERKAVIERAPAPARSVTTQTGGPEIFTLTISQTPSDWFGGALTRISELTGLPEDWDGYGAHRVDAKWVAEAILFLTQIAHPGIAEPSIVPLADGGLQIEWHRAGLDVEVALSRDDPVIYVSDQETGEQTEHAVSATEAVPIVGQLLGRLKA
jgi:hypothetical protein